MKKLILCTLFLPQLWLHAQVLVTGTDLSYAASKAIPAVVRIQAFLSDSLLNVHPSLVMVMNIKPVKYGTGMLAGSASGVLVSADGYIITNNHILARGDSLMVILQDRRAYRAVLIGKDDNTDLALLKIPENALPFLEIGDPAVMHIGDPVLAVGNPFDLTSTVTAGILSARFRGLDSSPNSTEVNSYLQTDAASNEGMSGSALVDRTGKLIGVNSAIISPTWAFAGYAFAIPSGIVQKVWHDLVTYRRVRHAYLDVFFSDMDASQAKRLLAGNAGGVLIDSLERGGAGEHAGMRKDDIILQMDRQNINTAPQLRELLAQHAPGDKVELTIARKGDEITLAAVLSGGRGSKGANAGSNRSRYSPVMRTNRVH
jgi:serine protease Do